MSQTPHKEKKSHYLAICRSHDGSAFLSNSLYTSDLEAQQDLGDIFERLARELPPLILSPKEALNQSAAEELAKISKSLKARR